MHLAPAALLVVLGVTPAPARFDPEGRAIGAPLSERTASYVLEARLDPAARKLTGRALLTWTNRSDVPQRLLWFHAYWNAFRDPKSTFAREQAWTGVVRGSVAGFSPEDRGWMELTSARLTDGAELLPTLRWEHPDDANADDRTVFTLTLPAAVPPQASVTLELRWEARVPKLAARSGEEQGFYFLGQWFPKLGVLEVPPQRGVRAPTWNCHQGHAATEYYADFGTYDATLTVPRAMVVGATGVRTGRTENGDGTTSHRFHQDDVIDFAWTAWDGFLEVERPFRSPGLPEVQLVALVPRGDRAAAEQLLDATATMLEYGGRHWFPYPYPRVTVVAPPPRAATTAGGMEYPTLFTAFARSSPVLPRDITLWEVAMHEAGHFWWQGMVASNEFEEAWLDEGINTWGSGRALESLGLRWNLADLAPLGLRGALQPFFHSEFREEDSRTLSRAPRFRTAIALPGWQFPDASATGRATYGRAVAALGTLEYVLGEERFASLLRTYAERFAFRHPGTDDFLAVTAEVGGAGARSLGERLFRGAAGLDDAVRSIHCGHESGAGPEGPWRCDVDVERSGDLPLACPVAVRFDDGREVTEQVAAEGVHWQRFTYRGTDPGARVREARVHPGGPVPLDADPTNDARSREATPGPVALVVGWFLHAAQLLGSTVGALL